MGNLDNPMLSRWGINLYWYNLIEHDKNQLFFLQKYFFLTETVRIFFFSGLTFPLRTKKSFFPQNIIYWKWDIFLNQKFRHFNLVHIHGFHFQLHPLTIPSRLWFFKFHNYIIIIFFNFSKVQFFSRKKKNSFVPIYLTQHPLKSIQPIIFTKFLFKKLHFGDNKYIF